MSSRKRVDKTARDNADGGSDDVGAERNPGQTGHQVDQEKRKGRDQSQGQQVAEGVLSESGLNRFDPFAEFAFDPIAQDVSRSQKGQGGARGGPDVDEDRPEDASE